MSLMDPIGDMFTRIRNGQLRSLPKVDIPSSNFRLKVLEVLKSEGFITNYFIEKNKNNTIYSVAGGGDTVSLLNGIGAINNFNFVSTAGGAFLEYLEGKELPGIKALN